MNIGSDPGDIKLGKKVSFSATLQDMKQRSFLVGLAILGIFVLAGMFRLYNITEYPPGLFPDQAANGEDALLILDGDVRPFYPRGNGREALFFYIQAGFIAMFGIGVWQMFAASAIVGIATVVATYFATRIWFGKLAGALAALFLATSYWHVTLSRTGFRAIMIPLFVSAFTAFVGYCIKAVKEKRTTASLVHAALAGAMFAGGFYTYIAYRVMIGVVLGIFIFLLLAAMHPKIGFPHFRRYGWQLLAGVIAAFITFLPLGLYFVDNPEAFIGRAGQVSIFSVDLQNKYGGGTLAGTLWYSTRETLRSFFVGEGDLNWRHNVAGFPLLNPLVGMLFMLGLLWAIHGFIQVLWKIVRGKEIHMGMIYPYLLLVLAGMIVPVITTAEGMPHGLRSVGLVTPIFMLAGAAGAVLVHWLQQKFQKGSLAGWSGFVIGLLALSVLYDGSLYFFITQNSAEAYYEYRGDLTEVSEYINTYEREHPDAPRPLLVLDAFSVQTVHYLTSVASHEYTEHPDEELHKYMRIEPAASHLAPITADDIIIFTQSTIFDAERYEQMHRSEIELVESRFNRFGQEIMRVYKGISPADGTQPKNPEFNLDA